MDRHPAAYIRRSFVDAQSPGDISEASQLFEVRKLARADGHNGDLEIYSDWGISADFAKSAKRTEYTRLLADMEDGRIVAVYAFDVDRLYRDPRDLIRLQDAAQRHNVTITTKAGRLPIGDEDDPAGEGFAFITAVFGKMERQKTKKRMRAALEVRRARGDKLGLPGYGHLLARENPLDPNSRIIEIPDPDHDPSVVVDAYRAAGSIMGAAKWLQAHGIKAPKGGIVWGQHSVTNVIEREAPEILPRPGRTSGRRTPTSTRFAQLIACHCGATLTPNPSRHQYYCGAGHRLGSRVHGTITVPESAVKDWVDDELAHLHLPADRFEIAAKNEAKRRTADARLDRVREDWYAQRIDRARWDREIARHDADLDALNSTEILVEELPPIADLWTYHSADVSKILRSIFVRVDLGGDMLPTSATWRNPALRRPCDDPACTHCPAGRNTSPEVTR